MIKELINKINNLNHDASVWQDNNILLEKEKKYKNRKIILLVHKRQKNWEGKFLVMSYKKNMIIDNDNINWEYSPNKLYKAQLLILENISKSTEQIQEIMENLFSFYFLEKKEKLKFKK